MLAPAGSDTRSSPTHAASLDVTAYSASLSHGGGVDRLLRGGALGAKTRRAQTTAAIAGRIARLK